MLSVPDDHLRVPAWFTVGAGSVNARSFRDPAFDEGSFLPLRVIAFPFRLTPRTLMGMHLFLRSYLGGIPGEKTEQLRVTSQGRMRYPQPLGRVRLVPAKPVHRVANHFPHAFFPLGQLSLFGHG